MSRDPVCIRPEVRVRDARATARERGVEHLLVAESDNVTGIVCSCDLESARGDTTVASCMKTPVLAIEGGATLREAAEIMREQRIGCLPVVSGKLLLGVITRRDLLRAGLSMDEVASECASCGAHHHLERDLGPEDVAFCVECLACNGARDAAELGTGD